MSYMSSEMIYDSNKGAHFTGTIVDDDGNRFETNDMNEYEAVVELFQDGVSIPELNEVKGDVRKTMEKIRSLDEEEDEPCSGECSNDCEGKCSCAKKEQEPEENEEPEEEEEPVEDDEEEFDDEDTGDFVLGGMCVIDIGLREILTAAAAVVAGVVILRRLFRR